MKQNHRKNAIHELAKTFVVGGGIFITRLLSLLIAIIVARVSGKTVFGEFTVFLTIFLIVSELPRVFDTTFIRFAKSPGEKENQAKWHAVGIIAKMCYIFVFWGIGIFLSPFLANTVFHKPAAESIICFGFFAGSILSIYTSLSAWFQLQSRFISVAVCRPVFFFVICLCLLFFYTIDIKISSSTLVYLYTFSAASLSITVLLIFFRQVKTSFSDLFRSLSRFIKIAGILILSSSIALVSNRLDIFFITKYVSFDEIGLYGVAVRLASIVGMMTGAISIVLLPKAAIAVFDKRQIKRYLQISFSYVFIQTLLASILVSILNPLVNLTVGKNYLPSGKIAIILIVQVLFSSYGEPFKALVECGNNPQWMVVLSVLKLIISLTLLMIMIPPYGLIGAAYAVTISAGIISLSTMGIVFKQNRNNV